MMSRPNRKLGRCLMELLVVGNDELSAGSRGPVAAGSAMMTSRTSMRMRYDSPALTVRPADAFTIHVTSGLLDSTSRGSTHPVLHTPEAKKMPVVSMNELFPSRPGPP